MKTWYFFIPWLAFSAITVIAGAIFFIWGKKTGQFAKADRARYLPLWAHVPEEDNSDKCSKREG